MNRWVMVEYYGSSPAERRPVDEIGVLEMTGEEASEMNKRLVWTPCRVHPAKWFPEYAQQKESVP